MESKIGEIAALATAFCWTITALAFESASKKVGSIAVNIIRLVMALVLLSLYSWFTRGLLFPLDADARTWYWLILSGFIGFVVGDLFLFEAFARIGSRISMLIMTLVPPITAILGWFILGEVMKPTHLAGMLATIGGISLVIFQRSKPGTPKSFFNYPIKGLFFAFLGAVGQAGGYVLSKYGMGEFDPFAATQIRVIAGIFGFTIVIGFFRRWKSVFGAVKQRNPMLLMLLGATFGPFLGVSLSLMAAQHTSTGIASTIMAIAPILIIPPTLILFKQPVTWKELVGAAISVGGVSLFFLY